VLIHQAICAEDRVIDEDVHRPRSPSVAAREHYGKRWKDERLWITCFHMTGRIREVQVPAIQTMLMTANEAASVTGVPLRQVHRIIDAGLLGGSREATR
jgi:hypothetical protein